MLIIHCSWRPIRRCLQFPFPLTVVRIGCDLDADEACPPWAKIGMQGHHANVKVHPRAKAISSAAEFTPFARLSHRQRSGSGQNLTCA